MYYQINDKYFWMVYYNDDKDTIAFCGNTGEVCSYLGIVPKSLWKHYNRKDRKHPKYLIFKYLTSDLDKEDDYEGQEL